MLTEEKVIDQINVLLNGQIAVRETTIIKRDGEEVSRTYHRHVVMPGNSLDTEDPRVRAVAEVVHTPEVIAAFRASIADA